TALLDDVYGDLNGQGTCAIGAMLAPAATYTCSFTGAFTGVGGESQIDTVTATGVDDQGTSVSAEDDAVVTLTSIPPTIGVVKTADPLTRPEPGGDFTFTVVVTNPSTFKDLTITSLVDDVYGDLNGQGTCAIGTTLAPLASYTCSFTGAFNGVGGDRQTDTVTATGRDNQGNQVSASDDAEVSLTTVAPTIRVDKTADPLTRPEPGGDFTFTVVVTNTSNKPLTITSLVDDVYGNLDGQGTCAVGAVLQAGASYTCAFTGAFSGEGGDSQTDTVTATGRDNQGNQVTANDTAIVSLTTGAPTIAVIKTADPTSRPAPGGAFTFTVTVTNPTNQPLTVVGLVDDIYGDLNGKGTCVTGTVLAPGQSYTCEFTGEFRGNAGDQQTDTVTATGRDNQGREVSATAKATVSLTPGPVPPVVNPPPPPPPPPPVVQLPLPRTGFGLGGPARLAVALILAGSLMVFGTLRRSSTRPALAVPSGPASSTDSRRRSGAQRSVHMFSAQIHRTKHGRPRWAGAKPSRFKLRAGGSRWNRFLRP
ncbi:MAG: hypothetical protein H0T70_06415, partial [Acidimicrobiia bacterium]|nr:hypothetical protein [Acidimicrobiia bacterium]